MIAHKKKTPELDQGLIAQGHRYDAETDEYVSPDGFRMPRAEWHAAVPDALGADQPQPPLTEEGLRPRNVREKMSVWFDQDIIDELRRLAEAPGVKMSRLINDALRAVYLPHTSPAQKAPSLRFAEGLHRLSIDDIRGIIESVMAQERQEFESKLRQIDEKVERMARHG